MNLILSENQLIARDQLVLTSQRKLSSASYVQLFVIKVKSRTDEDLKELLLNVVFTCKLLPFSIRLFFQKLII